MQHPVPKIPNYLWTIPAKSKKHRFQNGKTSRVAIFTRRLPPAPQIYYRMASGWHQDAIEQVVAPIFSPNFKKMCTVDVHITTENIFFTGYDHKEFVRRHLLAMKSIVKNTTQPPTSNTPTISLSVHPPATIIPACSHPLVQSPPTITTTNSSLVVLPPTMLFAQAIINYNDYKQ